jgi:hypothetical protein
MSNNTRTRKTNTTGSARTLRSVPDQTSVTAHRTDTEDKLWAALHAHPNSTATVLSAAAKIGKSTTQKTLAKWAADGSVTRIAGISEGGRRAADLWAIPDTDTAVDANGTSVDEHPVHSAPTAVETVQDQPVTQFDPDATDPDVAAVAEEGSPNSTSSDTVDCTDNAPDTDDAAGTADTDATVPVDAAPIAGEPAEAAESPATVNGTSGESRATGDEAGSEGSRKANAHRLAPGALRGMVEDYLRDHPGEEFGPVAIAKALGGKSSGAVSNALDKLVADGIAVKAKDQPRRFALAAAEHNADPHP